MAIVVECPSCRFLHSPEDSRAGSTLTCQCGARLKVPGVRAAASASRQAPTPARRGSPLLSLARSAVWAGCSLWTLLAGGPAIWAVLSPPRQLADATGGASAVAVLAGFVLAYCADRICVSMGDAERRR